MQAMPLVALLALLLLAPSAVTCAAGSLDGRVAPADPATTYNFLAIGDWGNDSPGQYATAAGMGVVAAEINATQVFCLGDNFYHSSKSGCREGSGICNGGQDGPDGEQRFKTTFEDVYNASSLQGIPFYAIAGNHDHGGNVTAQIAYGSTTVGSTHKTRWVYPDWYYNVTETVTIPGSNGKTAELEVLLFDSVIGLGNSDVVLEDGTVHELDGDSLPGPDDQPTADAQWAWLEERMASSTADYLWVGGHYPVWSIATHGPTTGLVEKLRPLLHKYEAHYFNGHDHDLEHIKENNSAVNYVTSGSGMACCYGDSHLDKVPAGSVKFAMVGGPGVGPTGSGWEPMPFDMKSGFTSYRIGVGKMHVIFHAHNGTALYSTQDILPRTKTPQPPLPPLPPPPPSPPSPPSPPPAPPTPTPAGMKWECKDKFESSGLGLADKDLTKGFEGIADCENACNALKGCIAVNYHKADKHCHVLSGKATHDGWVASLTASSSNTACMLVKSQ